MRVVLLKNVKTIGHAGETKEVRDGFAMNFLLPQKLAVKEGTNVVISKVGATAVKSQPVAALIKRLQEQKITVTAPATERHTLYAGITAQEIIHQAKLQLGLELEEKQLIDFKPLKQIGQHQLTLKLDGGTAILGVMVKEQHG